MTDANGELLIIMNFYYRWLLHNVPLIRLIKRENLTLLFEAKRAYVLANWLNLTRVIQPEPFSPSDRSMEMMKLDKDLSKLKGDVFDIRDFLYNGIHHRYKSKLYAKLRQRQAEKNYYEKLRKEISTLSPAPFITNGTEESVTDEEDENLFKDESNLSANSDKSYDDYAT